MRSPILSILGDFCSEIDDYKIYTFSTSVDNQDNVLACSQNIFIVHFNKINETLEHKAISVRIESR